MTFFLIQCSIFTNKPNAIFYIMIYNKQNSLVRIQSNKYSRRTKPRQHLLQKIRTNRQFAFLWVQPLLLFSFLAEISLYSYENDLMQGFLHKAKGRLSCPFISRSVTFCRLCSATEFKVSYYVKRIYPIELGIYHTTCVARSA